MYLMLRLYLRIEVLMVNLEDGLLSICFYYRALKKKVWTISKFTNYYESFINVIY